MLRNLTPGLALVVLMASGCALMEVPAGPSVVLKFPSPYSSDADFLNLASDNPLLKEQAQRNVYVFYNCLSRLDTNLGRLDPMVLFRSEYIGFSEIPGKIYQQRLDRLSDLTTQPAQENLHAIVGQQIDQMKRIRWNAIQQEVNAIITGARKFESDKLRCPVSDAEIRQQFQLFEAQRRKLDVAKKQNIPPTIFLPPFM